MQIDSRFLPALSKPAGGDRLFLPNLSMMIGAPVFSTVRDPVTARPVYRPKNLSERRPLPDLSQLLGIPCFSLVSPSALRTPNRPLSRYITDVVDDPGIEACELALSADGAQYGSEKSEVQKVVVPLLLQLPVFSRIAQRRAHTRGIDLDDLYRHQYYQRAHEHAVKHGAFAKADAIFRPICWTPDPNPTGLAEEDDKVGPRTVFGNSDRYAVNSSAAGAEKQFKRSRKLRRNSPIEDLSEGALHHERATAPMIGD